ncbi:MAG: hypothetical protein DME70_10460 [Verrucomicrobia bacterium]|nr:MAG: hypothetical protein DME70_10460 [Verrucomicrobiota bacterium]
MISVEGIGKVAEITISAAKDSTVGEWMDLSSNIGFFLNVATKLGRYDWESARNLTNHRQQQSILLNEN